MKINSHISSLPVSITVRSSVKFLINGLIIGACAAIKGFNNKIRYWALVCLLVPMLACANSNDGGPAKKPVYVSPSVDYKGKYRKGHVRMPVSANKNAMKNRNRSRYYYQTRGKYHRKKYAGIGNNCCRWSINSLKKITLNIKMLPC